MSRGIIVVAAFALCALSYSLLLVQIIATGSLVFLLLQREVVVR